MNFLAKYIANLIDIGIPVSKWAFLIGMPIWCIVDIVNGNYVWTLRIGVFYVVCIIAYIFRSDIPLLP